jgi:dolichol kinase
VNQAAPREAWRRTLHLASGSLALLWYRGVPTHTITAILLSVLALALLLEGLRWKSPRARMALERCSFGALRPDEKRRVTGATMLAAGYAAAWLLFPAAAAVPAILVTATADPAAALVGVRFGVRGRKTWAGSAAAFGVAFLMLLAQRIAVARSLAGALVGALAERLGAHGLDNLTMPTLTAAALAAWR